MRRLIISFGLVLLLALTTSSVSYAAADTPD